MVEDAGGNRVLLPPSAMEDVQYDCSIASVFSLDVTLLVLMLMSTCAQ